MLIENVQEFWKLKPARFEAGDGLRWREPRWVSYDFEATGTTPLSWYQSTRIGSQANSGWIIPALPTPENKPVLFRERSKPSDPGLYWTYLCNPDPGWYLAEWYGIGFKSIKENVIQFVPIGLKLPGKVPE